MSAASPELRPAGWRALGRRLGTHCILKATGTTAFMTAFFAGYFATLNSPVFSVTTIPATALDRWIGFHPASLVFYLSLWLYVALPPALARSRREIFAYGWASGALSLAGLGLFFFFPTNIVRWTVDWTQYPAFAFLQKVDTSGNACPSLHVAFAVFAASAMNLALRDFGAGRIVRLGNMLWATGIVYSTLATKQHLAIDVAAGGALGLVGVILHRRLWAQAQSAPAAQRNCSGPGITHV